MKTYVVAMEMFRQRKQIGYIDGFLNFTPYCVLMCFFASFFLNLTLCMTKFRVLVLSFLGFKLEYNLNNILEKKSFHIVGNWNIFVKINVMYLCIENEIYFQNSFNNF